MANFFENEAEKVRAASQSSGKRNSRSNSRSSKRSPQRGRTVSREAKGKKRAEIIPITKSLSPESKKKGRSLAAQIGKLKRELGVQGDTMKLTEAAIAPANSSKETISQKQAL